MQIRSQHNILLSVTCYHSMQDALLVVSTLCNPCDVMWPTELMMFVFHIVAILPETTMDVCHWYITPETKLHILRNFVLYSVLHNVSIYFFLWDTIYVMSEYDELPSHLLRKYRFSKFRYSYMFIPILQYWTSKPLHVYTLLQCYLLYYCKYVQIMSLKTFSNNVGELSARQKAT